MNNPTTLKNLALNTIVNNEKKFGNIKYPKIPHKIEKNIDDTKKLKEFLTKYYGNKADLYLNNIDYRAIPNDTPKDKLNELLKQNTDQTILDNLLMQDKISPKTYFSHTPLHKACKEKNFDIIKLLTLEKNADVNKKCDDVHHIFLIITRKDILTFLIQNNININIREDLADFTLMDFAIFLKQPEMVKMLLDYDFDINQKSTINQVTPIENIKILLNYENRMPSPEDREILLEILDILLKHKEKIDKKSNDPKAKIDNYMVDAIDSTLKR